MNTLRISPSAYIDALTLPELTAELVLAASRLVGTRVLESKLSPQEQYVCHECACRARERMQLLHGEGCITGWVAHVLFAIGQAEATGVSPIPHRKEPSQEKSEKPAQAAAQEKRPFVLPKVRSCEALGNPGWCDTHRCFRSTCQEAGRWTEPWTGDNYGEPWTSSADGEVLDCDGQLVVDPYGSGLVEPDEIRASRRIVACVNHCAGVPTEALCRETERAGAGGGM
jgi:hypothetical protein